MRCFEFRLPYEIALDDQKLALFLQRELAEYAPFVYRKQKQSIDARGHKVMVQLKVEIAQQFLPDPVIFSPSPLGEQAPQAIIIGAGPAGLFAAMEFLMQGVRPIIFEQGSDVQKRRRDLVAINQRHVVNPLSNYCFGEGGAGTYSDGKLYTRSKKRGDIEKILRLLVQHGATPQILVDAHPHIGTNKLPAVVKAIREAILGAGGEVFFDEQVLDILIEAGRVVGVRTNKRIQSAPVVVLACGHSARPMFEWLHRNKIALSPKPFALGVRIEHPQLLIDTCQYHLPFKHTRGILPAAPYSLVYQYNRSPVRKGVFSFCMCPGGFIVPAATEQNELVVNGMSPSKRDAFFANSGIVVEVDEQDWKDFLPHGALAAMVFQRHLEQRAHQAVNEGLTHGQFAPAQRLIDFVQGKKSTNLLPTSYQPGLRPYDFHTLLPPVLGQSLKAAVLDFDQKIPGYIAQGQMIGLESRTSSPVRIPRDVQSLQHPDVVGLYPCAEGAGYAGGIVSAAMDGQHCARAAADFLRV